MTGLDAELKEHRGLVVAIARRLALRMPTNVELDDLVQEGMLGLWDALRRFDPAAPDANFAAFASQRIRGAMLDAARRSDTIGRRARSTVKAGARAARKLEHASGRPARAADVAAALGLPAEEYHDALALAHAAFVVPLEDVYDAEDDAATPYETCLARERQATLEKYLTRLKEKDADVIRRLLRGEILSSIAESYGVSESAVGHRLRRILGQLKTLLAGA